MITSAANPRIRRVRRFTTRRYRRASGRVLVEGARSVAAALAGGRVEEVLVTMRARPELLEACAAAQVEARLVADEVMAGLSSTASVPPALAIALSPEKQIPSPATGIMMIDVRDPSEVGALVALAAATGSSVAVAGPGTADPFDPRSIRAAGGAHWSVAVVHRPGASIDDIRATGAVPVALVAEGGVEPAGMPERPCLVVCGAGDPAALGTDVVVSLPKGSVEPPLSLRAAGVLYEWVRRSKDRAR